MGHCLTIVEICLYKKFIDSFQSHSELYIINVKMIWNETNEWWTFHSLGRVNLELIVTVTVLLGNWTKLIRIRNIQLFNLLFHGHWVETGNS